MDLDFGTTEMQGKPLKIRQSQSTFENKILLKQQLADKIACLFTSKGTSKTSDFSQVNPKDLEQILT
jgi:hypothetical protein